MPEEYRSNSIMSRERKNPDPKEKAIEKVVSGNVKQKKKGAFASVFLPGDIEDVKDYIFRDVIVPTVKRTLLDSVTNGLSMMFGESSKSKSSELPAARVSYRSYYRDDRPKGREEQKSRQRYSYDELVFENRGDAEEVLYRMQEVLDHFQIVSVADLFEMAGVTGDYTDNKYGWTDLEDAYVRGVRGGWIIDLPRPTVL